jgi:hypothetical protein
MGGTANMDATQDSSQAQKPAPTGNKIENDHVPAAKAAKDLADALKAAAEAQKSQSEAQLAAFKAMVGEVPTSGYAGTVELKDKAGSTEAALLAALAAKSAAENIARRLAHALTTSNPRQSVLLFSSSEVPNFQALIAFRSQTAVVEKAFDKAEQLSKDADTKAPPPMKFKVEAVPVAGAAGLALDAVNKLLGFFRTDYTVGGIELSLDDSLLVQALAGNILDLDEHITVKLPALYNATALTDPVSAIMNEATQLSLQRLGGTEKASREDQLSTCFADDAGKQTDLATKTDLLSNARAHKDAADGWRAAIALCDGFFSKLTTADDKGVILLTSIVREGVVADALHNGHWLLVVKIHKSGGSYYTKKNMWSFFSGMPFYHMGGVVASYILIDGKEGSVRKSGVVPVHGGFVAARELQQHVNGPTGPPVGETQAQLQRLQTHVQELQNQVQQLRARK